MPDMTVSCYIMGSEVGQVLLELLEGGAHAPLDDR